MLKYILENYDSLLVLKPKFNNSFLYEIGSSKNLIVGKENLNSLKRISKHYSIYHKELNTFWTLSHLTECQERNFFGKQITIQGHFLSEKNFLGLSGPQCIVTPGMNFGKYLDLKESLNLQEDKNYNQLLEYLEKYKIAIKEKISYNEIIDVESIIKEYKENNGYGIKR